MWRNFVRLGVVFGAGLAASILTDILLPIYTVSEESDITNVNDVPIDIPIEN